MATSVVAALVYAVLNGMATLHELAAGVLQGVGVAIGGLLGSALIMRYQSARGFLRQLVTDVLEIRDSESVRHVLDDLKHVTPSETT